MENQFSVLKTIAGLARTPLISRMSTCMGNGKILSFCEFLYIKKVLYNSLYFNIIKCGHILFKKSFIFMEVPCISSTNFLELLCFLKPNSMPGLQLETSQFIYIIMGPNIKTWYLWKVVWLEILFCWNISIFF